MKEFPILSRRIELKGFEVKYVPSNLRAFYIAHLVVNTLFFAYWLTAGSFGGVVGVVLGFVLVVLVAGYWETTQYWLFKYKYGSKDFDEAVYNAVRNNVLLVHKDVATLEDIPKQDPED